MCRFYEGRDTEGPGEKPMKPNRFAPLLPSLFSFISFREGGRVRVRGKSL